MACHRVGTLPVVGHKIDHARIAHIPIQHNQWNPLLPYMADKRIIKFALAHQQNAVKPTVMNRTEILEIIDPSEKQIILDANLLTHTADGLREEAGGRPLDHARKKQPDRMGALQHQTLRVIIRHVMQLLGNL
ncbi:hypothetical protein D3C74_273130 [compost metagenome]